MTTVNNNTSLRVAAVVAGLGLLIMVGAAPFAELYAWPKLVVNGNAAETVKNIAANRSLFAGCIFGYLTTFTLDIIVAWALYVLLQPVNDHLSLLAALFRLVYAVIALVALLNLITVFRIATKIGAGQPLEFIESYAQVGFALTAFKDHFHFGILFFGIHLLLLGYMVFRSVYIPKILGPILIISSIGYITTAISPYLLGNVKVDIAKYTFFGELIFMLWLLIRGWKIKYI